MKLLLKAAMGVKRHLILMVATGVSLVFLTIANSLEMCALGVLTQTDSGGATTNPLTKAIRAIKAHIDFDERAIQTLVALLIGVALFKAFFLFASRFSSQLLSVRISRDLREQYFSHIQSMPMSFFHKYDLGALSYRVVGDANQIALSINSFFTNYLSTPFTIAAALSACFYMSWRLSLVIFFGLPMIVLPVILITKRVKRITRQLQRNHEKFTSVLLDFLGGIQTVKIFAMEAFTFKKYKEQNDRMAHLETKTAKYDLLTRPILHTVTTACLATVAIVGIHILKMSLSELIVFVGFLHLFYEPVKKFAEENTNIQKGVVAAERLFEVLSIKPQIEDRPGAALLEAFEESIEFDRVSFKYDDTWVLKDVSFTVRKGETVALVGATGAGKSTIVSLLPRLYDVQQGEIRIDGIPITDYTQQSLRKQISFVPQRPFLFLDTIASNIAHGESYSEEEIALAIKKAHAAEFITDYNAMVAEQGKNFSGGQQQRLAIARALAKKAPILVLDEATSALDSVSERHIQRAIEELHGEVTQIIIAHRLSTIEHADRIIFLANGEKIAEGSKEHLLETCPQFQLMWETHYALRA